MPNTDLRIDAYIARSAEFAMPILTHLRAVVHAACPDVEEAMKWSAPSFTYRGKILCGMRRSSSTPRSVSGKARRWSTAVARLRKGWGNSVG